MYFFVRKGGGVYGLYLYAHKHAFACVCLDVLVTYESVCTYFCQHWNMSSLRGFVSMNSIVFDFPHASMCSFVSCLCLCSCLRLFDCTVIEWMRRIDCTHLLPF